MAAQQKVSNERKKELEQMDPFQESLVKGLDFLNEYKKQCLMIVGAVVAVVMIFSGIMYSFKKSEETAALLVSRALTEYAKAGDTEKGYLEIKDDFALIFKDYSNTSAGKQARVKFAKICYDAAKYDQSYIHYKEALDLFDGDVLMENFLLASLGHVSIAIKDFDEAEKYFLRIQNSDSSLLKDEADYVLARLYEASDKEEKSKEIYERIVANHENSLYIPLVKSKIGKSF